MDLYMFIGVSGFVMMGGLLLALEAGLFVTAPKLMTFALVGAFGTCVTVGWLTYSDYDWHMDPPAVEEGGDGKAKVKLFGETKKGGEKPQEDATTGNEEPKEDSHSEKATYSPGQEFRNCSVCPIMVAVKSGPFVLGRNPEFSPVPPFEGPARSAEIKLDFAISKYAIKVSEYQRFIEETQHKTTSGCLSGDPAVRAGGFANPGFEQGGDHPAVCLSAPDAAAFVNWLVEKTKLPYRLVTAEEWEYVAKGPDRISGEPFAANERTRIAGKGATNAFNAFDLTDNVGERVADCWIDSLAESPLDGSPVPGGTVCAFGVVKGGAWYSSETKKRPSSRRPIGQRDAENGVGFRIALSSEAGRFAVRDFGQEDEDDTTDVASNRTGAATGRTQ